MLIFSKQKNVYTFSKVKGEQEIEWLILSLPVLETDCFKSKASAQKYTNDQSNGFIFMRCCLLCHQVGISIRMIAFVQY